MGGELYNPQTKVYSISIYLVYKRYILPIKWLCTTYHPLQDYGKILWHGNVGMHHAFTFMCDFLWCRPATSCEGGVAELLGPGSARISQLFVEKFHEPPFNHEKIPGFGHLKTKLFTLPGTNIAPENRPKPNRKVVFQPSIFRGENVSFREGTIKTSKNLGKL